MVVIEETITELSNSLEKPTEWVAWVGAGLSSGVYCEFEPLIEKICTACNIQFEKNNNYYQLAEKCKNQNGKTDIFYETIYDEYKDEKPTIRVEYFLLLKLDFAAYITTNYDPSLKLAHYLIDSDSTVFNNQNLDSTKINNKNVFYIHGLAQEASKAFLLLAESDLKNFYSNAKNKIFFDSLFLNKNIIFIGYSLSEPQILHAVRRAQDYYSSQNGAFEEHKPKKLIALVKDDSNHPDQKQKEEYGKLKKTYEQNGVKLILYNDHDDLYRILKGTSERRKGINVNQNTPSGELP